MDRTPISTNPHKEEDVIVSSLKKNYVDGKMNYDNFYNEINYVSPGIHIKQYLPTCLKYIKPEEKWLDVGCGSGNELKAVIKNKIEVHGMDIVDKSVRKAKSNGIECIKNSAADPYPYTAKYFDIVTCTDVLEHLTETDARKAVKQIYRVLKDNRHALLAPALSPDRTGYLHLTVKDKQWWIKLFEDEGFTFVEYINPKGILVKK